MTYSPAWAQTTFPAVITSKSLLQLMLDGAVVHQALEVCGLVALGVASLCVLRVWTGNAYFFVNRHDVRAPDQTQTSPLLRRRTPGYGTLTEDDGCAATNGVREGPSQSINT
eukprot:m.1324167 g.1324167  ORF g.1324167 m.1324167 type:complete len:112 (+) comp24852_c1_seq8:3-338(+)